MEAAFACAETRKSRHASGEEVPAIQTLPLAVLPLGQDSPSNDPY